MLILYRRSADTLSQSQSQSLFCCCCSICQTAQPGGSGRRRPSALHRHLCAYRYAHAESAVRLMMVRCATWLMLASASPRKPYVPMLSRSSNARSLLVVKRSQTISRSSRCHRVREGGSARRGAPHAEGKWALGPLFVWRVKQQGQRGVCAAYVDAAAVVLNLQQLQPAVLDGDGDGRRSGVEAVAPRRRRRRRGRRSARGEQRQVLARNSSHDCVAAAAAAPRVSPRRR